MSLSRAALIAAAVALASPAFAQDWKGMGRLSGKVMDPDGKPIPDVTVRLELPARGGGTTVKTNKKGEWALLGIAAGAWNVDFEAAGYASKKISVSLPGESARLPPVETRLEKAAPKGPPPEVLEAVQKGDDAYKAGRFAEARVEYEKLLALRPDLGSTLHLQIARCYKQEGNYEKELEHLQLVLDADPANTEIKTLMAMEAVEGGQLERGLQLLETVDQSKITSPDVFFNIGVGFRNKDKPDAAVAYFSKAVALDPNYVDGYFQRALTFFGLQKFAEAKADFKKVLELSPAEEAWKTECTTNCQSSGSSSECKTSCESRWASTPGAVAKKVIEQLK